MVSTLAENVHKRRHTFACAMQGPPRPLFGTPAWGSLNLDSAVGKRTRRIQADPRGPTKSIVSVGRLRTVKARWAHVPSSAAPTLTVLALAFREILFGDVHTDVHAGGRQSTELAFLSAMRHEAA